MTTDNILDAWKQTVEVQEHFNDLQLRLRNFMITVLIAVLGAAGFVIKEHTTFVVFGTTVSATIIAALAGVTATIAFYFMDYGYHRLLMGAVKQGMDLEQRYPELRADIGLALKIKDTSRYRFLGVTFDSNNRLHVLYCGVILCFLLVGAFGQVAALSGDRPQGEAAAVALRRYYSAGKHGQLLDQAAERAILLIDQLAAPAPGMKRAVVFDVDDTAISTWEILDEGAFAWDPSRFERFARRANAPGIEATHRIYEKALAAKLDVLFITSRHESLRGCTENNLKAAGYGGFSRVVMMADDSHAAIQEFKTGARRDITASGTKIVLNVGDQLADLAGGYADNSVLLPNPFYSPD